MGSVLLKAMLMSIMRDWPWPNWRDVLPSFVSHVYQNTDDFVYSWENAIKHQVGIGLRGGFYYKCNPHESLVFLHNFVRKGVCIANTQCHPLKDIEMPGMFVDLKDRDIALDGTLQQWVCWMEWWMPIIIIFFSFLCSTVALL